MIWALNDASPTAFGLMDYWTFDGWFALKARQGQPASRLKLELINQPLSRDALVEYARYAGVDKLAKHGFEKSKVASDDAEAFKPRCRSGRGEGSRRNLSTFATARWLAEDYFAARIKP